MKLGVPEKNIRIEVGSAVNNIKDRPVFYNLIGSKNVSNNSILNCFKFIKKISRNRKMNDKT